MRIIDDKGKLFGFINIIDLAVLSIIILLAGGFIYKSEMKKRVSPEAKEVIIKAYVPYVHPEVAKSVHVGDRLVAGTDFVNVWVEKVEVAPANFVTTAQDGSRYLTTDPFRKDVFVELKGKTPITGAEIVLGGQKIRIGREDYFLKTLTYELKATVLDLEIKG